MFKTSSGAPQLGQVPPATCKLVLILSTFASSLLIGLTSLLVPQDPPSTGMRLLKRRKPSNGSSDERLSVLTRQKQ